MIEVTKVGERRRVYNPRTGQHQEMVAVEFVETSKRDGGNSALSLSSNILDDFFGVETGLPQFRTHTHLVRLEQVEKFKVGTKIPTGFINRRLTSFPEMVQQSNVDARWVDGKPTFFNTYIGKAQEDDIDQRMSNEKLADIAPEIFKNARVGATRVDSINEQGENMGDQRLLTRNTGPFNQETDGRTPPQLESASLGTEQTARPGDTEKIS